MASVPLRRQPVEVVAYHPVQPTVPQKLWWPWMFAIVQAILTLYTLTLTALWIVDGADNEAKLHIGYYFGPQLPLLALVFTPYIIAYEGTFEGIEYSNRGTIVEQHASWITFRTYVLFILTLVMGVVDTIFFVLRVIDFASNCGTGTVCDKETATYAISAAAALIGALVAVFLAILIVQCPRLPASVVMPAPPPASTKKDNKSLSM